MTALFALVVIAVVATSAVVAAGRLDRLPLDEPDRAPAGPLDDPRFDVVARGYRMDEVDQTVAALTDEIARLRAERR